jgi:hypothetical protein
VLHSHNLQLRSRLSSAAEEETLLLDELNRLRKSLADKEYLLLQQQSCSLSGTELTAQSLVADTLAKLTSIEKESLAARGQLCGELVENNCDSAKLESRRAPDGGQDVATRGRAAKQAHIDLKTSTSGADTTMHLWSPPVSGFMPDSTHRVDNNKSDHSLATPLTFIKSFQKKLNQPAGRVPLKPLHENTMRIESPGKMPAKQIHRSFVGSSRHIAVPRKPRMPVGVDRQARLVTDHNADTRDNDNTTSFSEEAGLDDDGIQAVANRIKSRLYV